MIMNIIFKKEKQDILTLLVPFKIESLRVVILNNGIATATFHKPHLFKLSLFGQFLF